MYTNYNDYELLYLINEGSEKALDLLFNKYDHLIRMIAKEYAPYGNKSSDLAQEFRMVLFRCIKCYNESCHVSFYTYFLISLNRKAKRVTKNDYYTESKTLNENYLYGIDSEYGYDTFILKSISRLIEEKYNDKISLDLIYKCIIGGYPMKKYAEENNLSYSNLYYKYKKICSDIKESLILKVNSADKGCKN